MSDGESEEFDRLCSFIGRELAFESEFYNDGYLDRRITARMRRTDSESYRAYQRLLRREDEEREALLDSLSITVTGFFRDPEAWEALRPLLRTLTDDHRNVTLWSTPCADGREPYSAAMLARDDPEVNADRISILGTDINADVLEEARAARYESSKTTDIEAELALLNDYTEYIDSDGDSFTVREPIREMVEFERHDLIRGESSGAFDLVLCRNLLIYIDEAYKAPVFETIHDSLRTGGYLLLGMTEMLPTACRDAFEPVDRRHRIYRKI